MSFKSIQSILVSAVSLGLLATGCKREDVVSEMNGLSTAGKANVKIIHASAYNTNYSVHLKVNGVKVSNNITNATPFPGGGLNTGGGSSPWYLALTPGSTTISLAVPKVGSENDSISLYTGSTYLDPDRYYSVYLTDTSVKTQLVTIAENISKPANNTTRFKFINLMPNETFMDLYWGTTKVASNVAYTTVSPDFTLNKADTGRWYIRPAGAAPTSAAIAIYPAITPTFQAPMAVPYNRVMTVFSRGYKAGTGNRAPNVSLLYNN